jgi:hypothetical protein
MNQLMIPRLSRGRLQPKPQVTLYFRFRGGVTVRRVPPVERGTGAEQFIELSTSRMFWHFRMCLLKRSTLGGFGFRLNSSRHIRIRTCRDLAEVRRVANPVNAVYCKHKRHR